MGNSGWQTLADRAPTIPACQPAADTIGDLGGRGLWEFERLLAAAADPEPLVERVADQLNPMLRPLSIWLPLMPASGRFWAGVDHRLHFPPLRKYNMARFRGVTAPTGTGRLFWTHLELEPRWAARET